MINLIKNTFLDEENTKKELCNFILNTDKLSMGEKVEEFEKEFSKWQGRDYSVMFNSGSSANLALLASLKNLSYLSDGEFVGFSALTWATNVMPITQLNLTALPIDISLNNLNLSVEALKKSIELNNIRALFITNALGFSSDLKEIRQICDDYDILLLEDNCESLGSKIDNEKLGNFGLASTFSFYVGHHLSTIEGGMVCTDNWELYEMLKMVRAHGWTRNNDIKTVEDHKSHFGISEFYNKYSFYYPAYNLRPTEINGFIGLEELKNIDKANEKRERNFVTFLMATKRNDDLYKFNFSHMTFISNFAYPLVFRSKELFEKYRNKFAKAGIEIRPIIGGNICKQPFYNGIDVDCPNATLVHEQGFYFPNNPDLSEEEIEIILEAIKNE